MVDTKDILLKAAEDAQSGMWCKVNTFKSVDGRSCTPGDLLNGHLNVEGIDPLSLEDAIASKRCAQGSLALATMLLGGRYDQYDKAREAVERRVGGELWRYNDHELPDDPFEAGQQLAELFRATADAL